MRSCRAWVKQMSCKHHRPDSVLPLDRGPTVSGPVCHCESAIGWKSRNLPFLKQLFKKKKNTWSTHCIGSFSLDCPNTSTERENCQRRNLHTQKEYFSKTMKVKWRLFSKHTSAANPHYKNSVNEVFQTEGKWKQMGNGSTQRNVPQMITAWVTI